MSVLRAIGGAIVGYAVIAIVIMVSFTLLWMVLGAAIAFKEGTTETSLAWSIPALVIGVLAAILGGSVARRIGGRNAVYGLAGLLVVLGLWSAVMQLEGGRERAEKALAGRDPADLTAFEAASATVGPAWFNFLVPFTGMAGVLLGGRPRRENAPRPES